MTRKNGTAAGPKRRLAVWIVVLAMVFSLGASTMAVMADEDPASPDPAGSTIETTTPEEEGTAADGSGDTTDESGETGDGAAADLTEPENADSVTGEEATEAAGEDGTAVEQEPAAEEPLLAAPAEEPAKAVEPQEVATVDQRLDGITINLFDYDIGTDQNSGDTWNNNPQANQGGYEGWPMGGINSVSNLKFFGQGGDALSNGDSNKYTGTTTARQGIVQSKLSEDGYPVMTEDFNSPDRQELSYLFDPNESAPGKTVYSNVGNLFQKNGSGNYTFNSNNSYAYYDPSQGSGGTFKVFEPTYNVYETSYDGSTLSGDPTVKVGYFPFDEYDSTKLDVEPALDIRAPYKPYNHQHGLTMEGSFKMPASLKADGQDIKFHFSGDDDAWLFVDDVLVLDIGGLHRPVGGDVNFTTGEVTVDSVVPLDPWQGEAPATIGASNTLKDIFEAAGETWDPTAEHTYKFFYLERGGCYSNLALETNLWKVSGTSVDVEKVWSDGNDKHGDDVVTVQLLANGEEVEGKTLTLSADNDWKDSFVGLPENDAEGNPIEYTVKESYPGYTSDIKPSTEMKGETYWVPADPNKLEAGETYAITAPNYNDGDKPRILSANGDKLATAPTTIKVQTVPGEGQTIVGEEGTSYSQFLEKAPADNQQFVARPGNGENVWYFTNNGKDISLKGKGGYSGSYEYCMRDSDKDGWDSSNNTNYTGQVTVSPEGQGDGATSLLITKMPWQNWWGGYDIFWSRMYLQNGTDPSVVYPWDPAYYYGHFQFWKQIVVEEEGEVPNSWTITNTPKGYGDLVITKTLPIYDTSSEKESFVFLIHAELNGKVVYDDVITLDFTEAGTAEPVKIEGKIPVDAEVTVTEVYSGAAYNAENPEVKVTILPKDSEEPAEAVFMNYPNGELTGGEGVLNTYTMGSNAKWLVNGEEFEDQD